MVTTDNSLSHVNRTLTIEKDTCRG